MCVTHDSSATKSIHSYAGCLSTAAIYYLGNHGCGHHGVGCHLCHHGGGFRSCLSAGDSRPGRGRAVGDGLNFARRCSADSCRHCAYGSPDADRGRCCAASNPRGQGFRRQTIVVVWRSCRLTAPSAACGPATSCSSA